MEGLPGTPGARRLQKEAGTVLLRTAGLNAQMKTEGFSTWVAAWVHQLRRTWCSPLHNPGFRIAAEHLGMSVVGPTTSPTTAVQRAGCWSVTGSRGTPS